ncbi:MAG: T9SS type A sorting domain-containing protein [Candidatus Delongbacteria bacterium]|nr:T9SS type A sorting domain-containing protein [Candidatus Delongbacteria bacterium]
MKKCMLLLIIVVSLAFSQNVIRQNDSTFVYPCTSTEPYDLNFVGLPLETGWTMASDFDLTGTNLNAVSKWNTELLGWETAGFHSVLGWGTDFPVETGGAYMINAVNDFDFTVTGDSVDVVYDLVNNGLAAYNPIVYPLGQQMKSTYSLSSEIPCNTFMKFSSNQVWLTSTSSTFWLVVFDVEVGQPLVLVIEENTTWPNQIKNISDTHMNSKTSNEKRLYSIPRVVYWHIQNENGSELNFQYDDVNFEAWITGRDDDLLTSNDVGCGKSMVNGNSVVYINLANFYTNWTPGEELNIYFHYPTKEKVHSSFFLTYNSAPVYRGFETIIPGSGEPIQVVTNSIDDMNLPAEITLHQNYPNPFNPTTSISFSIPQSDYVKLSVYNIEGQLVNELINGKMDKGIHNIEFNAESYISGEYIYKLEANGEVLSRKMLLIK